MEKQKKCWGILNVDDNVSLIFSGYLQVTSNANAEANALKGNQSFTAKLLPQKTIRIYDFM